MTLRLPVIHQQGKLERPPLLAYPVGRSQNIGVSASRGLLVCRAGRGCAPSRWIELDLR